MNSYGKGISVFGKEARFGFGWVYCEVVLMAPIKDGGQGCVCFAVEVDGVARGN